MGCLPPVAPRRLNNEGMTTPRLTGAIELPDGTWIRGRGLGNPAPEGPLPTYGLYLGSAKMRRKYDANLTWQHDWIEWPDFRLPKDRDTAIEHIRQLHEHAKTETAEVACGAGIGRTGTVIACLAVLSGIPAEQAVEWTRTNHHRRAVETPGQRNWVSNFPAR
jgi:hypothetical protein